MRSTDGCSAAILLQWLPIWRGDLLLCRPLHREEHAATGLLVAAAQVGRLPHWLEALVRERASASARWTELSEQCTAMFGATNEVIEGLVQPFTRVARIVALLNQCHGRLLEHVRPCLGVTTTYIIADETLQQTKQQHRDKLL